MSDATIRSIDDLVAFVTRFQAARGDPRLTPSRVPGDLPRPLREVYLGLGALADPSAWNHAPLATQDALLLPERIERIDGMIVFATEYSGNWSAICAPDGDDPVVLCNSGEVFGTWEGFAEVATLEHFLVTLCLQESVLSSRYVVHDTAKPGAPEPQALVEVPLVPLWLGARYVFGEPSHDFWTTEDESMLVMKSFEGTFVARRPM